MAAARPLDYVSDGSGRPRLLPGPPETAAGAGASYAPVKTPEEPPYSVEGRIFVKQGNLKGYCSGTAINSPSRQLVLTAGHCINSGPRELGPRLASDFLEFVPAYSGGVAPFGAFVSRRGTLRAPPQWINFGNPDFDLGAFLTFPNSEGVNVADAVGGGATIALDKTRHQTFRTFGYPGQKTRMEGCEAPYVGDDATTYPLPGPPTMAVECRWAPGASGGGWLIGDGSEINGVSSYLLLADKSRTFSPYFTRETVGKLVRGY
ncbi:MAG: serine protease [Solirubrobacterales bacterium]